VRIGIVGKYTDFGDTYKSLNEALHHGGLAHDAKVELVFIDSEGVEQGSATQHLSDVDGILVPGGFGERGTEGKITAIEFAREKGVPFFGICLGMQLAVVEYARHVLGLKGVESREFNPSPKVPIIELLSEQRTVVDKGGTMRLGSFPCELKEGSLAHQVYGERSVSERHRHRFEVHPDYHKVLTEGGLEISGASPDGLLAEVVELPDHPYFLACQFHPEFKSRPLDPHPLFAAFVRASLANRRARESGTSKGAAANEQIDASAQRA
jgi:CTP synthase